MKLGQLSEASIYASDLAAAEKFYRDILGLEKISSLEDRGVAFRCGATVLLVFDPARTRVPDAGVPPHGASGEGHIAFVIEDSEFESWRNRLMDRGVAIEAEVNGRAAGVRCIFAIRPGTSSS